MFLYQHGIALDLLAALPGTNTFLIWLHVCTSSPVNSVSTEAFFNFFHRLVAQLSTVVWFYHTCHRARWLSSVRRHVTSHDKRGGMRMLAEKLVRRPATGFRHARGLGGDRCLRQWVRDHGSGVSAEKRILIRRTSGYLNEARRFLCCCSLCGPPSRRSSCDASI